MVSASATGESVGLWLLATGAGMVYVGETDVNEFSECQYSEYLAGRWISTWVTACVPDASCWRDECLYLCQIRYVWGVLRIY